MKTFAELLEDLNNAKIAVLARIQRLLDVIARGSGSSEDLNDVKNHLISIIQELQVNANVPTDPQ